MHAFLRRLGAHAREKFVIGVSVVLIAIIGATVLVVAAPDASVPGTAHGSSATTAATALPGATGTPHKGTTTPTTAVPTGMGTQTPSPQGISGLVDTYANIHLGLVFDSGVNNLNSLQGKIDVVWGATTAKSIPGAFTISYNTSDRIGNGTNGPLYSIDWFKQHHPDWIVYTCDKTTPAFSFNEPNTPLDITNPQVLQFIMAQEIIPQIQSGYQGIGFDNIGPLNSWQRCGHFDANHTWVPLYSGLVHDPTYEQSLLTWGKAMYTLIKQYAPQVKVAMNFSLDDQMWNFWNQMLANVDFLTDEGGFTNFGSPTFPYITDSAWNTYVAFLQTLQGSSEQKGLFLINELPSTNITSAQLEWSLANYLLVKEHAAYVTVVGNQQYGQFYDHPEYHIQIGTPTGEMASDGCAFARTFTQGMAVVNPSSSSSCTVKLPHPYKTVSGATVTTLTLGPHSGSVLLGT
jgi:hypothetical protein